MTAQFIFTTAPFVHCHASTLVELPDGDLLTAWFAGTQEGAKDVGIWLARHHAGTWTPPKKVADEPDVPCWNPVLFCDPGGLVWLFYKVGPSPQTWTGAYRTSADGGRTWSPVTYLPAGLLGPIKNKPLLLSSGELLCGTSVESYRAWACWVEISTDGGQTWTKHGPITVPGENYGVIQPTLWEAAPGRIVMLTRATQRIGRVCRATSEDGGRTWAPAQPTTLPNPNSGLDAVRLHEGTVALVYNHTTTGRTPLNLAFSQDDGLTWSEPLTLEDQPGEYSYPAIIQTRDGNLHLTYTWRRIRIKHLVLTPEECQG